MTGNVSLSRANTKSSLPPAIPRQRLFDQKMAPRPSKTNDRAKSAGGAGKRKLDFMQEEEDDDYEVVKAHRGGDDSDDEMAKDISSALVGGSSSRQMQDDGYGTEEEEAEIASMMGSKLKADGMTAVKAHAAKGKGKEKETKGLTGGGSWQSMGESQSDMNIRTRYSN